MRAQTNSRKALTRFTLEFSFSIPKAGAAHHLAILPLPVPLLPNLVVDSIVMAPLWRRQGNKNWELSHMQQEENSLALSQERQEKESSQLI